MNNIIKRKWNQNSMVIIEDLQGMAFQAESGGHTFQISGIDGEGNAVALSGTPAGVMLRADGQDVTLTCSVSGGVVSATLPANAYSVPGRFGLTIFLTSDGQKTAIYAAVGTVGKTSSGTVAPPAGSDVVTLVNQINAAIAAIPVSYNSSFAPAYSTSGLYSVGQYVTYNGNLYRCNTAITTAETWTAAHWTQTNLGADVYDLKSALNSFVAVELGTMTSGYIKYDDGSVQSNDSYTHTDYLELYGAKQLRIKGAFQYSAGIAFYDAYKFYISGINGTTMGELKQVTVPDNAKYIRASKHNSYELIIEYAQLERAISENTDMIKASDERDKSNSVYVGDKYVLHPELFKNGINNGSPTKSSTRVLTDFIELYDHRIGININSGYQYTVSLFDANKAYISGSETSWRTRNEEYLFSSAAFIRILIAKSDATQSITKQEAEQNITIFFPWYWNNIMKHDLTGKVPIQIKWEQGRIDEDGDDESSANGVRSRMIIANSENSIIQIIPDKVNTNYCYKVAEYESNQTTLKKMHEYSTSYYPFVVGSKYFRIEILDTTWTGAITPSVVEGKVEVSFIIENLLPDNYRTMIKDREGYISTYSHRQGLNVLFITDTHMEELTSKHISNMDTSLESFRSAVELANNLNVDLIIHGGDVIHGASANGKTDAFNAFQKTVEIFKNANCPVLFCRGNHDDNMYHSDNSSDYDNYVPVSRLISIEEWLIRLLDPMKVQVSHDSQNINSSYYFYDFPLKKKRIIILDPYDYPLIDKGNGYAQWVSESWNKFSDRQLAWLENEALGTVPEGYEPIIFLHGVLVDGTGETKVSNASAVRTILNTYNNSHTNKIYNVIYGHTHFDIYTYEDGINFFCTACGFVSHYSSTPTHTVEYFKNPERTKFTGTEMRFDVYSLKGHTSKRLKCGAGESQVIT